MKKAPTTKKKIDFTGLPDVHSEPRFSVEVLECRNVAKDVIVLQLKRPENFAFQAGQYIWLVLPERSKQGGLVDRRAYSISSGKDDEVLELLIRISENDYLMDVGKLKNKEVVEIIGPFGGAFVPPLDGAILIAGGTGISPFLSILRSKLEGEFSVYGFESVERPIYAKDELATIAKDAGYEMHFFSGKVVSENLQGILKQSEYLPIFISGPQVFVNNVYEELSALGIKRERMFFEACYPEDDQVKKIREVFKNSNTSELTSVDNIFFQIARQTSNHVVFTDKNGVILYANEAALNITGYTLSEMFGQTPRLWGGLMPKEDYEKTLWHDLREGVSFKRALLNRHKSGRLYAAIASITPILEEKNIIGYVATEEDVTDLRDLDKAKSEFVSLAAHQLRTPLTAISWYTEMILNGDMGAIVPDQKKYLEQIYKGNKTMIELVDTLLNVSRLELGTLKMEQIPVELKEIAESVFEELKPQILSKNISLEKKYNGAMPVISIGPKLIRIIFQNLLGNAVKYVGIDGKVRLDVSINEGEALIKVWNNGLGIPKEDQPKIFTKLFRDSLSKEREPDGNGLGLYIVKSIVESSGGRVWFESPVFGTDAGQDNPGVTFYVALPLNIIKKK